jgi:hypothetical protein
VLFIVGGDRRAAQVITQQVVDGAALLHGNSRAARVVITGRHAVAVLVIVPDVIRRHAAHRALDAVAERVAVVDKRGAGSAAHARQAVLHVPRLRHNADLAGLPDLRGL